MNLEVVGLKYLVDYVTERIEKTRKVTSKGYINSYDIF